ncbi:MAG: TlpA disulfide reductase family protein [Bacteroidales bacterium]|nr:TlpA disulfide reductase family protein [Bacteroidales bacterium]
MRCYITILVILISGEIFSQHFLNGVIEGYDRRDVNICSQFGDESKLIETVKTNQNGEFVFSINQQAVGLYRIYLDTQDYFDLIYNNEDIEIRTKVENPQYNMEILKSAENIQLYTYIIDNYISDYKIDVLDQLKDIYPDGKFRNKVESELKKEIKIKNKNLEKVIKQNPDSFTGRYLKFLRELSVPSKYNDYEKSEFLKKNYLSYYKFNDLSLLNSNAYTTVVLNYFKLYRSNNPEVYYTAAKEILDYIFFEDPKIFNFVFEYVLSGFESLGLDEQAAKISVEFGDLCSDGSDNLKMRIKSNTELSVGKKAPDFSALSTSGKKYTLSEMKTDYTLIIFWATWCEHCKITMPRLAAASNIFKEAKMDIIAISIDSDEQVLKEFLKENQMPWDVLCEYKGWDGQIVVDYAIFATPSMYIVDKELNIIAKPYNEERLYDELEKILTK